MVNGSIVVTLLLAAGIAAPARGYDWEFERVDAAGSWSSPSLRMSGTGILHFCYRASGNVVVHSYRDSVWHREELGPFDSLGGFAIDAGPHGEFGVVLSLSSGFWLCEKQDTSWSNDSVPLSVNCFGYDTAGAPSVVSQLGNPPETLLYSRRTDTVWLTETVAAQWGYWYSARALTYTVYAEPCIMDFEYYPYMHDQTINLLIEQADTWRTHYVVSGGMRDAVSPVACGPDTGGGAAVLYNCRYELNPPQFRYSGFGTGGAYLDTSANASAGAVSVDRLGTPHVAYILTQLRYACRIDATWHFDTIPTASGLQLAGMVVQDSLPVVGFVDQTGVWLARRQPAGIDEHPQSVRARTEPTVVTSVLFLSGVSGHKPHAAGLADISGRRVMDLRPGANDVRALPPGVYVIEAGPGLRAKVVKLR
jgi:hypothetical protein